MTSYSLVIGRHTADNDRYDSNALIPRVFIKALAYHCRELEEVSLNLEQPLPEDEGLLHVWNNLYPFGDDDKKTKKARPLREKQAETRPTKKEPKQQKDPKQQKKKDPIPSKTKQKNSKLEKQSTLPSTILDETSEEDTPIDNALDSPEQPYECPNTPTEVYELVKMRRNALSRQFQQ